MKTKYLLLIYIIGIHCVFIGAALYFFYKRPWPILISEGLILISLLIAIRLYRRTIAPIEFMSAGIEALNDQDFSIQYVRSGNREVDDLVDVFNRMIEMLRQERIKTKEQHFFLEKLIEAAPVGVIIMDFDERISILNPKALTYLHLKSNKEVPEYLHFLTHPLAIALSNLKTGESINFSSSGADKYRCSKSHFIDQGFRRYFILIEDLGKELLEAEKNAYGKVIRMMAHEVNNSVGSVNSLLDSFRFYSKELSDEHHEEFLQAIEIAIERNIHMGQFMANFADVIRLPAPDLKPVGLFSIVEKVAKTMQHQCFEKNIELVLDSDKTDIPLMLDIHQMEQALINIIKNAIESIEQNGQISILINPDQKRLTVRDSGKGITPETRVNLFSTFFSTKKNGQGLGLTMVRDILTQHHFSYSLETKPEGFTEFEIRFL